MKFSIASVTKIALPLSALFLLSGCLGLLVEAIELRGLLAAGGRGLAAEAAAGEMIGAAGGARLFAARAVSSNVGAAVMADEALLSGGARSIPMTVRGGGSQSVGRIFIDDMRTVRVRMGTGDAVKLVRAEQTVAADGLTVRHYSPSGEMISYSRYSPDKLRFDYFAKVSEGQYRPAAYGLRSPTSGDVTLFGPNHRYLGRAIYRTREGAVPSTTAILAASALIVSLDGNDEDTSSNFNLCSEHYLLLRQTHFQQLWDSSTPLQFWNSMYADCPNDRSVILAYRETLLNDAVAERDHELKLKKLDAIIDRFPDFEDARLIRSRVAA